MNYVAKQIYYYFYCLDPLRNQQKWKDFYIIGVDNKKTNFILYI